MDVSLYELVHALLLQFRSRKERGIFSSIKRQGLRDAVAAGTRKVKVPVAESTREQRNAVVRYWRQRDSLHLGPQSTPTLYFDGKKVVKKSSIASVVATTFDQAKAGGCKKLRNVYSPFVTNMLSFAATKS